MAVAAMLLTYERLGTGLIALLLLSYNHSAKLAGKIYLCLLQTAVM